MMRTKFIPLIIMLIAGLTACAVTYYNKYTVSDSFIVILLVLIIFYIIGCIVRKIAEKYLVIKPSSVMEETENNELNVDSTLKPTKD